MRTVTRIVSQARIGKLARNYCKRILATTLLTACVLVAPAFASVTHAPLNKVRVPRIDSRVIENLQRWADEEKDSCPESIRSHLGQQPPI